MSKDLLYVIKVGGNVIDDEARLSMFLKNFSRIEGKKILVHGGGKLATTIAEKLKIPQKIIEGRRVTDAETLKVVIMVYAGYINKNIVSQLQAVGTNAIGICGADGNTIRARMRDPNAGFGFVGDIETLNIVFLKSLLQQNITVVIAPITHNSNGQLLNTNADTIAQEVAKALSETFEVHLVYTFEKSGVLMDATDDKTVIPTLDPGKYSRLKENKIIANGMVPKLDNAFAALESGVSKVTIGNADNLLSIVAGESGTMLKKI